MFFNTSFQSEKSKLLIGTEKVDISVHDAMQFYVNPTL